MYAPAGRTGEVNELRYQLFCAKRGEVESSQLPPCRDCLFMHVLRANYQAAIWNFCLQAHPAVPNPTQYGWTVDDDDKLAIHWMRAPPAPDVVLELLACKCVRSCKLPECTCLTNELPCTEMCKLQTCSNNQKQQEDEECFELNSEDEDDGQFDD